MKRKLALTAILSALLLTACTGGDSSYSSQSKIDTEIDSDENTPSESSDHESELSKTEEAAPETADSGEPEYVTPPLDPKDLEGIDDLDNLYGPDGEKVDKYTITNINYGYDDEGNQDKTKWFNADCVGFAYYSEPQGFSYNSVDNADLLDKENWRFNVEELPNHDYKRCAVGDIICGLKVSYVSSMFGTANADTNYMISDDTLVYGREFDFPEIFFSAAPLTLKAALTRRAISSSAPRTRAMTQGGIYSSLPTKKAVFFLS